MVDAHHDRAYRPFAPFERWVGASLDLDRWQPFEARLDALRARDSVELQTGLDVISRMAAIDTGAIERLYRTERGFTFTVAAQRATAETLLKQRSRKTRSLIEDQLAAYEGILDLATQAIPVNEAWIRGIHRELCRSQETYTVVTDQGEQEHELPLGEYKRHPNHVTLADGTVHAHAPVEETPREMARLVEELGAPGFTAAHPILQAAYAHHAVTVVHPSPMATVAWRGPSARCTRAEPIRCRSGSWVATRTSTTPRSSTPTRASSRRSSTSSSRARSTPCASSRMQPGEDRVRRRSVKRQRVWSGSTPLRVAIPTKKSIGRRRGSSSASRRSGRKSSPL